MKNLLFVTSSLMGDASGSVGIGRELVEALKASQP